MITVTHTRNLLSAIALIVVLASCGRNYYPVDTRAARDNDKKAFVKKTDGEVIEANEARLRTPLFKKSTIELDRDVRIPVKDIVAYQNSDAFYYRTPSGLAPRVTKGLLNMYRSVEYYTSYEGPTSYSRGGTRTRARIIYYLQKGDDAPVSLLTPKLVDNYVSDYAPAKEYMDLYFHNQAKYRTMGWINTAGVVGGLALMIAAGDANAAGYGGLGLFAGGLISGFVNKIHKVKNTQNVMLSIDEYNMQAKRTKRR